MTPIEIPTHPYPDQKPGTAGLRKSVEQFQKKHYLENFLQSIFDTMPQWLGAPLVVGGDGRYFNRPAIATAIAMAAANGIGRVIVGQHGFLSTPAASHLIAKRAAAGGLVFTASHNPAGPGGDFGIKFSVAGGGQASETLTDQVYANSKMLTRIKTFTGVAVDLDRLGEQPVGEMIVEVIDPVEDYAQLMQSLFDFDLIRSWIAAGHSLCFDAMHAITGPYAQRIFVELLGVAPDGIVNGVPLEDFGGGHPDPNLVYAKSLVDRMMRPDAPDIGAASDGDGDRNMIVGRGIFIPPGDSLAMLAAHLHKLPGYRSGLAGVARSMPTSRAVDRVAEAFGIEFFETATGWKFFANLLEAGRITLCGEESFGTSSSHVREKDGVWAALAWINVVAESGLSVAEIAWRHWGNYGRHYFARHDYQDLSAELAREVVDTLQSGLPQLVGKRYGDFTVSLADSFAYQDPIDGSTASNQGLRIVFGDAARIVVRLSGTGTQGATVRIYLERYERIAANLGWINADALAPLAVIAEQIVAIAAMTGRRKPDLIT